METTVILKLLVDCSTPDNGSYFLDTWTFCLCNGTPKTAIAGGLWNPKSEFFSRSDGSEQAILGLSSFLYKWNLHMCAGPPSPRGFWLIPSGHLSPCSAYFKVAQKEVSMFVSFVTLERKESLTCGFQFTTTRTCTTNRVKEGFQVLKVKRNFKRNTPLL